MIKLQILQNSNKKYFGEIWVDKHLEFQGVPMTAEIIAIRNLNKAIDRYNSQNGLVGNRVIPHYPEIRGHLPIVIDQAKKAEPKKIIETEQVEQTAPTEQVESEPKPSHPKRKPFTPYGLNGYLVDKNGNVRLMLDRRANASTIVLEPQMFGALAEMVKKTQEQQNVR
ncbi:hypothetical protein QA331_10675 [Glaesserella parasuis]|uniref:hypothetical protein n=1 Tax=Glaesserella parasuis TaxID=738 RepID=UPI0024370F26|nr:hypothetical protein [Glaesserella parasuis]MDG6761873.1 hypothetical protein [Glaesserella parasuis]